MRRDTPQSAADDILAAGPGTRAITLPAPAERPAHSRRRSSRTCARSVSSASSPTGRHTTSTSSRAGLDLTTADELLVVSTGFGRPRVGGPARGGGGHRVPGGRRRAAIVAARWPASCRVHRALPRPQRLRHACRHRTARSSSRSTIRAAPVPQCNGFGATLEYDESLIVPDPTRSLRDGAIDPWTKPRYETRRRSLLDFAEADGVRPRSRGRSSRPRTGSELLYGSKGEVQRDLSLPQEPRGEALQAVHPRLPAAVPDWPSAAPPAAAPGSTPTRWPCASAARRSARWPRGRWRRFTNGSVRSSCHPSSRRWRSS